MAQPQPTPGALLTYADLVNNGPPRSPGAETFHANFDAAADPTALSQFQLDVPINSPHEAALFGGPIIAARAINPQCVYVENPYRARINLDHHAPDWGQIIFTFVCPVNEGNPNAYVAPNDFQRAVVKKLKRSVVDAYLNHQGIDAAPGLENPYKEASRLQEFGDNITIVQLLDLLQDEEYMYIITPEGHTLLQEIEELRRRDAVMPLNRRNEIVEQLFRILARFEQIHVCHHDLKPENLLFVKVEGREVLLAFDFALSDRIPANEETGRRTLMTHPGRYGTPQWMDPLTYQSVLPGFPRVAFPGYDGVFADLWAAAIVLYSVSTNYVTLYSVPLTSNVHYLFYVELRGLFPPLSQGAQNFLVQLAQGAAQHAGLHQVQLNLLQRQPRHDAIPQPTMALLEMMLVPNITQRASLGQVITQFAQFGL
jgi:serine/threonine protein kinase